MNRTPFEPNFKCESNLVEIFHIVAHTFRLMLRYVFYNLLKYRIHSRKKPTERIVDGPDAQLCTLRNRLFMSFSVGSLTERYRPSVFSPTLKRLQVTDLIDGLKLYLNILLKRLTKLYFIFCLEKHTASDEPGTAEFLLPY